MLKNSVSRTVDMNVFGSSPASETKRIISNLEHSIKSFSSKFEHLLEENHTSIKIQQDELVKLQLTCNDITERMKKIELNIIENTDKVKNLENITPTIISRINTVEAYYKDKP